MNRILLLAAISLMASPALAQAPGGPDAAAAGGPAASTAGPAMAAPDGGPGGVKALRAGCRDEAKAQGLTGEARREAVSACVVKARPELAGREQCRSDGLGKGLHGQGLHAFVKDCVKSKA